MKGPPRGLFVGRVLWDRRTYNRRHVESLPIVPASRPARRRADGGRGLPSFSTAGALPQSAARPAAPANITRRLARYMVEAAIAICPPISHGRPATASSTHSARSYPALK